MLKNIELTKLCCGGNDFLVADFRNKQLPQEAGVLVRELCLRRESVGADGAIFLLEDAEYPFRIALFNSDGSPAEVSYNGSRCVALYAAAHGIAEKSFAFASDAGAIKAEVDGNNVTINVPAPCDWSLDMELEFEENSFKASYVKAGVPYLVFFVDDLYSIWVETVPAEFKTHPEFPAGTNVAVVKAVNGEEPQARFFERGVEEETPSSGSGCVAVASICHMQKGYDSPVNVKTQAGDFLISFEKDATGIKEVLTAGEVIYCFDAKVEIRQD
jgi:diaminopimelate epimerase